MRIENVLNKLQLFELLLLVFSDTTLSITLSMEA